ncbi:MAG: hypothetical protein L3J13_02760 [Devosiaceae bacterium]|nr:hypothetical protein [Devosiaceae bacterium]
MWIPPLLIIPLLIYNAIYFGLIGGQGLAWASPVFTFDMPSGAVFSLSVGDTLIVFALMLLLFEGVRARRAAGSQFVALSGSGLVFVVYLGQFFWHPAASTSLFFICMVMSFVDFVTRITFSSRGSAAHYYED